MHIRCPDCRNAVEIVGDSDLSRVACPSCGDTFKLLPPTEAYTPTAESDSQTTRVVGHFRLLEQLGAGGFGTVWKARDTELDRLVAIKIPRRGQVDATDVEMFMREARAAAQLKHPHIVAVHEVGRENGTLYIVSDFVQGVTLADRLTAGPMSPREAAQLCARVAEALIHAHENGVIHRDLKPSNIILDSDDVPHLMDFGLAKREAGEITMTVDGMILGTAAYMSPEQARGEGHHVDRRSDIYSLGVILFELLTGERPFRGNVRNLLHQVMHDDPPVPRKLNGRVPRDLETICLKCLEKEPANRYASAAALADDLARYLEGRPIVARPAGPIERAWRWCRRNPRVAALMATVAALAGVAVTAIVVGYVQTTAALAESEKRLDQALEVVNDLFTRFSEDELLDEPGMQPLRKDLLDRALKHYNQLLAHSSRSSRVQDEVAAAQFRVGRITDMIGAPDAALHHLSIARTMQEELLDKRPGDVKRLRSLADTLNALGSLHVERKSPDKALESYSRAAEIRSRMVEAQRANPEFKRLLANTWMNLGIVAGESGDAKRGSLEMNRAQKLRDELLKDDPNFAKARRDLAMGYYQLAKLKLGQKERRPDEAAAHLQAAVEQFEKLPEDEARSLRNRYFLAVCYRSLAAIQEGQEDFEQALANYERASLPMESLAVGNPDVPVYQRELIVLALKKAVLYEDRSDLASARAAWAQMLRTAQALVNRDRQNVDYRIDLATAFGGLGGVELLSEDLAKAAALLAEARDLLQKLVTELPDDPNLKQQLADTLANLADAEQEN